MKGGRSRTGMRIPAVLVITVMTVLVGCGQGGREPSHGAQEKSTTVANPPGEESVHPLDIKDVEKEDEIPPEPVAPDPVPDPLPGALLVMIDNHPDARPQNGLQGADVVYEAVAEGGITRFLAVFHSRSVKKIGPVRSTRPYFIEIAKAYDSPFAHVGASNEGYRLLAELRLKYLDAITRAGGSYWRVEDRRAPHSTYTSTERLLADASRLGFPLTEPPALAEGRPEGGEQARGVRITYVSTRDYTYVTEYHFDADGLVKLINGRPFPSADEPVTAGNVVVIITDIRNTGDRDGHMEVRVTGSGDALFLTGGRLFRGRWEKREAREHFRFTLDGREMVFGPGPTWINIASPAKVSVLKTVEAENGSG